MSRRAASTAVMAVRSAVRRSVEDLDPDHTVLVACSGGADSLALAAAAQWCATRGGPSVVAVVIDHGLQEGSSMVAEGAAATCRALGIERAVVVPVSVGREGGPEAAARTARYAALEAVAVEVGAAAILLGHTREDQAETVLLRLARGSGARSLSGMRERSGPWRRPLLSLARADVRAAAVETLAPLAAEPWSDPHNDDPHFARVRVRRLLDDLVEVLGPGAVLGLARSADLLRDDADALDAMADEAVHALVREDGDGWSAECDALAALPRAVRTRVLRALCLGAGCIGEDLTHDHVQQVETLISAWRGQGPISLPGGVIAQRAYGRLWVRAPA